MFSVNAYENTVKHLLYATKSFDSCITNQVSTKSCAVSFSSKELVKRDPHNMSYHPIKCIFSVK